MSGGSAASAEPAPFQRKVALAPRHRRRLRFRVALDPDPTQGSFAKSLRGGGGARAGAHLGYDSLGHLLELGRASTIFAIVHHILLAHQLLPILSHDADPAVVLPRRLRIIVLELHVEARRSQSANKLRDAACVVVPPTSVHVRSILQH